MAVTAQLSDQITAISASPRKKLDVVDDGKLRLARFSFTQVGLGDAGSTIDLVKIGMGRFRIIPALSYIKSTALASTATIDVGHTGYTKLDGTTQAGVIDAVLDGLVATAAVSQVMGSGTNAAANATSVDIESKGDVLIRATIAVAGIPDASVISGWIAYVRD